MRPYSRCVVCSPSTGSEGERQAGWEEEEHEASLTVAWSSSRTFIPGMFPRIFAM
jgi:hypothetical protein